MGGSVGREVRPSPTAAGRAQVSRSVGSPESGRAAWAADERVGRSVGHPVSRLSGRGGPVGRQYFKPQFHEKRSDFIKQMPARIGHYSHAEQKQEQLNLLVVDLARPNRATVACLKFAK